VDSLCTCPKGRLSKRSKHGTCKNIKMKKIEANEGGTRIQTDFVGRSSEGIGLKKKPKSCSDNGEILGQSTTEKKKNAPKEKKNTREPSGSARKIGGSQKLSKNKINAPAQRHGKKMSGSGPAGREGILNLRSQG